MQSYFDLQILASEPDAGHTRTVKFGNHKVKLRHHCRYVLVWLRHDGNPSPVIMANIPVRYQAQPPRLGVRLVPRGYTYVYSEEALKLQKPPEDGNRAAERDSIRVENHHIMFYEANDCTPIPMVYEDTGEEVVVSN